MRDYYCLLLVKLPLVKVQFGSFQDVTIAASRLSGSTGDLGKETSGSKLLIQGCLQCSIRLSLLELGHDLRRLARHVHNFLDGLTTSLLDTNLDTVMGLIPRFEGMSINKDNGSLDQGLGTDQFVVGGIVGDIEDSNLASTNFGPPRKVATVQSQGPEFLVATAASNLMDPSLTNLGHGGRSTHFKLSLLAVFGPTASRLTTLVTSFTRNTHGD
mmetsp:Transcript_82308/g.114260  ORF Transcript_82308/g.114260 Transcript_82308/m.114260 type:complete len:214 (+) Transcript_82308:55-696(+)